MVSTTDGSQWFLGSDAVFRLQNDRIKAFDVCDEALPDYYTYSDIVVGTDYSVWVTCNQNLAYYADGEWYTVEGPENIENFTGLDYAEDHIYATTKRGDIVSYNIAQYQWQDVYAGTNTFIYDIQVNNGNIWLATEKKGVIVLSFQDSGWDVAAHYTIDNGLPSNWVRSMDLGVSDNIHWFGTQNGVACYDGDGWYTYTAADGLANDSVIDIERTPNGDLWFVTFFGAISRFSSEHDSAGECPLQEQLVTTQP